MDENTRNCLHFSIFDENDKGEGRSFIFEELTRSSFTGITANFNGKQKLFLSLYRLAKIRVIAKMMEKEFQIMLPSDKSWRLKNYFKLLNKQKEKTLILHMMPPEDEEAPKWEQATVFQPEFKRTKLASYSHPISESSLLAKESSELPWTSLDLVKAAKLLGPDANFVKFEDEAEMRRIYSLIYDVYRYKHILSDALRETGFFQKHPEHSDVTSLIWLLFFDLHKRRFLPRGHAETLVSLEAFERAGLADLEQDIWDCRVKLAASLARARIKNNALRLNQLLPPHLRDERFVSVELTPVTGWINTFKKSKKEICDNIEALGLNLQSKHETVLTKNDFRFDHLCPKLLLCHPLQRQELAQSDLVKNHTIILQDRAFCIGPALFGKILMEVPLRGTVAQTHVNSPKTTAYLASVLIENDRLDKLIAFGAGEKLLHYQTYLHELGVTNCEIYAQKFAEIHPEAAVLENLVAVLATPPNSNTAVTDPVDLICSRGGDLGMLKSLTEPEMIGNCNGYLDEQRETLKYCMSLPQVQIILYETHSVVPEENFKMVNNVIDLVNNMAKEKHEEENRLLLEREEAEEKANKPVFIPGMSTSRELKEKEEKEVKQTAPLKEVVVPPCDLFELANLPELCQHGPDCFADEGCFLVRVQRKEIISLDAKYMIKIAEARGLFGAEMGKKKTPPRLPKKPDRRRVFSATNKVKRAKLEIERLAAPTQSTISRTKREPSTLSVPTPPCPRHQSHAMETINKGDTEEFLQSGTLSSGLPQRMRKSTSPMVYTAEIPRNSIRSKKSQEESVRRLSRPITRGSTNRESFTSEVKARFWRYATAKSIEDLIRAIRKKRKGKRIYKMEDYFFFKDEQLYFPQSHNYLTSETGVRESFVMRGNVSGTGKTTDRATILSDTPLKPKVSNNTGDSYYKDIDVIKPYINKGVIRITSYGAISQQSSSQDTPLTKSILNFPKKENCSIIKQCMDNVGAIFQKIDDAIEENKKIAERKLRNSYDSKEDPFNQRRKFKNKHFSPLEALSRIEEISNIVNFKKNTRTDLILPSKYLPNQGVTKEQETFVKNLQEKLGKIQQSYQHWTKWQESNSIQRLSTPKRVSRNKK